MTSHSLRSLLTSARRTPAPSSCRRNPGTPGRSGTLRAASLIRSSVLARVKTVVWNGPFGAFEVEPFDNGTVEVAEAAAELTAAGKLITVAGGGDTVSALNGAGVTERFTYVSTAGGSFLEWLEGKALPGVEVMRIR